MKNQALPQGKKLNKQELNKIKGGLKICILPETTECAFYGNFCGEPQCKIRPL